MELNYNTEDYSIGLPEKQTAESTSAKSATGKRSFMSIDQET